MENQVGDHANDGDAEAHRGVVHGLCDAVRENPLAIGGRQARSRDGAERVNQTEHGAEEPDQRRDVRERPERADPLLDRGFSSPSFSLIAASISSGPCWRA